MILNNCYDNNQFSWVYLGQKNILINYSTSLEHKLGVLPYIYSILQT